MKKITFAMVFFLLISGLIIGQQKGAAVVKKSDVKAKNKKSVVIKKAPVQKTIQTDTTLRGRGKQQRRGRAWNRDRFIDKDGDGINDNCCQGLGWGCGKCSNYGGKRTK